VTDHGPPFGPGDVLLDGDGKARLESALDAIGPAALVRVTVVGVEDRPVTIQKIERRLLGANGRAGKSA
jgi:hypothetical protein